MKAKEGLAFGALMSVAVSGCSTGAPDCSDERTKNLVFEIVRDEIGKVYGSGSADNLELGLDAIRTKKINEKTGSRKCAAVLKAEGEGGKREIDITYLSELADNGEEYYVTVYGL